MGAHPTTHPQSTLESHQPAAAWNTLQWELPSCPVGLGKGAPRPEEEVAHSRLGGEGAAKACGSWSKSQSGSLGWRGVQAPGVGWLQEGETGEATWRWEAGMAQGPRVGLRRVFVAAEEEVGIPEVVLQTQVHGFSQRDPQSVCTAPSPLTPRFTSGQAHFHGPQQGRRVGWEPLCSETGGVAVGSASPAASSPAPPSPTAEGGDCPRQQAAGSRLRGAGDGSWAGGRGQGRCPWARVPTAPGLLQPHSPKGWEMRV